MTRDGRPTRRALLRTVPAAATASLAGCSLLGNGEDPATETTTSYGYGGSPTTTAGEGGTTAPTTAGGTTTAGDTTTDGTTTDGTGGTTRTTAQSTTATRTTTTPADEYGLQGYGQYDYGG